ncbi:hypothetical protein [Marinobacterium aestuariivivens]|uniref:Uncharacterized protein n=1 Tax=Marinobacterium aestuariivivens TaxID=1698799 RepID=A0ABW1ZZE1_9GAMM
MFWPSNWKLDKTRLLSWLIPDSHRGRILLIMLLGLLMTQLASYWAWRHQVQAGQIDLVDKVSNNVAYSVASTVKFFTDLPRQYRHMVLDQLRKMGGPASMSASTGSGSSYTKSGWTRRKSKWSTNSAMS